MIGLGTIINCIAIAAGSSLGVFLKGGLPRRFETTIMQALGLCTFFIGIGGAVSGLLTIADGSIATQHTMLLVLSMVLGALIGEALDIETRLNGFGAWCQARFAGGGEDGKFVGLAIDEADSEAVSSEHLKQWIAVLKEEGV